MSAQGEIWRVSTAEGIFEADLETLKQWIAEGCVRPNDKVCRGGLNWIEAGRTPLLRAAFRGGASVQAQASRPAAPPTAQLAFNAAQPMWPDQPVPQDPGSQVYAGNPHPQYFETGAPPMPAGTPAASSFAVCHNHPQSPPKYICRACSAMLCAECPKFVGQSKIPICSVCGDLCRLYAEEMGKAKRQQFQSSGFGLEDFGRAFAYPFKHLLALLFGAALYGFLLIAGFKGQLIAYVIMFGCISHVISQVSWGRLDRSFMPDFSSFSMWDDLLVPLGLGISITIVTWGPAILLVLTLLWGGLSGPGSSQRSFHQSDEVQFNDAESRELARDMSDPNLSPEKARELNARLERLTARGQLSEEARKSQQANDPITALRWYGSFLGAPVLLVLLLLLAVCWAVFYYPMALAVAGYTQSFGSVINPLTGLDTIRRMGAVYFKAFAMVLVVQIASLIIGIIVAVITSPFDLPFIGNLPARFIDGSITFYFNLVIACTLGLALHKCADRLDIGTD